MHRSRRGFRPLALQRGPVSRSRIISRGTTPFLATHRIEQFELENGLKVILVRDPAAPVVSYQTWFRVGARHEREGITGIAHLFEHLMFKETTNLPEGAFSKILEEAGARDLNAWTWYDETVYTQSVPKQHLELVARLESDRMVNLILNEAQLSAERKVVINERRFWCEDDPYGRINEALSELAFDVHPYRWPVIGWRRDIEAITLEDCLTFYRSFYAPNNATLILTGDLETRETLDLIDRYYGHLERQPIRWPEIPDEPEQLEVRRREMRLSVESEILNLGIRVPALRHPDRPALQVLDIILFNGKSSRLERKLVDAEIASSVSSMLPPFVDPSLYEVQVNLREGRTCEEAEGVVFDELSRVVHEGVTRQELDRARCKCKVGTFQELRDNSSRANFIGLYEVAAGGYEQGLEFLRAIDRVTLEDVQRVAATYLKPERASILVARPAETLEAVIAECAVDAGREEEDLSTEALEEELELEAGIEAALAGEPGKPEGFIPGHQPPIVPETPWKVETWPMEHGSSLFMIEDHTVPLVSIQVLIPGGNALEPEGAEGLAGMMGEMLLRGTQRHSREAFEEALDDLGASIEIEADADHFMVTASGLAENWDELMGLLKEALLEPAFESAELEKLRGETLAAIQEARNDDKTLCDQWFGRLLFPGHPYGRSSLGTPTSVATLTREDVVAMYRRAFHRTGVLLGVAGALSGERAAASMRTLVEALPDGPVRFTVEPPPIQDERQIYLIDKPERTQTQIMIGHTGIRPSHPDHPLLTLGTLAFGGSGFTTRLMQEVREKRGWSYGAYARLEPHKDGGAFSIWVFPAMGDAAACLGLVLELYEQVKAGGISDAELDYARRSILNGAAFDEDTPERCLRGVINRTWRGVDRRQVLKAIADATLEQVNGSIRRHYHPDRVVVTLVCTASQIEPVLREAWADRVTVLQYDEG